MRVGWNVISNEKKVESSDEWSPPCSKESLSDAKFVHTYLASPCILPPGPGHWDHWAKVSQELSSWCLGLNRLALKSATYVSRKSPDLPVSEVKLPFFFLLSRKPQSLVTTFSFPSSLKLSPPPILKSG